VPQHAPRMAADLTSCRRLHPKVSPPTTAYLSNLSHQIWPLAHYQLHRLSHFLQRAEEYLNKDFRPLCTVCIGVASLGNTIVYVQMNMHRVAHLCNSHTPIASSRNCRVFRDLSSAARVARSASHSQSRSIPAAPSRCYSYLVAIINNKI
jgi:hypothetical protein